MPDTTLYSTLLSAALVIEAAAAAGPTISWSTYKSSPPTDGATVELTTADFNGGTLRITSGNCVFKLTENISVQPGTAPDFFPTESAEFPFPPYQLGWFAGIAIETSEGVVINLNGYRIEQTQLFALQQRFYALIEIGDQPFLEKQGPSQFGPLVAGTNITIKNGILGRSSHHGIHSPGSATNILIEDLQIQDFEVAGIHLNGATNTVIRNCHIGSIRNDVPVLGTYSQCRFIRPFVAAIDGNLTLPFLQESKTGTEILTALDSAISAVYNNIAAGEYANKDHPECTFMTNTASFARGQGQLSNYKEVYNPDGGAYGLVLNRSGVAVNGFLMTQPTGSVGNSNILVENVCVSMIESGTIEVVGVSNPAAVTGDESYGGGGAYQSGPAGDIFRIDELTTSTNKFYQSTVLSNAQLFVSLRGTDGAKGTANIPTDTSSGIMGWALSGTSSMGTQNIDTVLTDPPTNNLYRLYNGDAMAHVCKGNIGIFIQGANDIEVKNCNITDVIQQSLPSLGTAADYPAPNHKSHPAQSLPYYGGATTRGIAVASSQNIALNNSEINLLQSLQGNVVGMDFIGVNTSITTTDMTLGTTKSPAEDRGGANQPAMCCPMRVRATTSSSNITSTGRCPARILDASS